MTPASPVIPGASLPETVYAKDQPEYTPLPVFRFEDGTVLSRWKLSLRERLTVLLHGDVYLWQLTFGKPLQPVKLEAVRPKVTIALTGWARWRAALGMRGVVSRAKERAES